MKQSKVKISNNFTMVLTLLLLNGLWHQIPKFISEFCLLSASNLEKLLSLESTRIIKLQYHRGSHSHAHDTVCSYNFTSICLKMQRRRSLLKAPFHCTLLREYIFTRGMCQGQTKYHIIIRVCVTSLISQGYLQKNDYQENQKEKFLTLDREKINKLLYPHAIFKIRCPAYLFLGLLLLDLFSWLG